MYLKHFFIITDNLSIYIRAITTTTKNNHSKTKF